VYYDIDKSVPILNMKVNINSFDPCILPFDLCDIDKFVSIVHWSYMYIPLIFVYYVLIFVYYDIDKCAPIVL
jgi:hypothetical protein